MLIRRMIFGKKRIEIYPYYHVESVRIPQEVMVPLDTTVAGQVVVAFVRLNRLLPVGNRTRGDVGVAAA